MSHHNRSLRALRIFSGTLTMAMIGGGCAGPQPTGDGCAAWISPQSDRVLGFQTVEVAGATRRFAVLSPRVCRPGDSVPVIVFLNGRGECGTDGMRQMAVGLGPAAIETSAWDEFLIVAPQKPAFDDTWERHQDLVLACLDWVEREYAGRVDLERIYLTGLSQGGAGTFAIAAAHPERFAAVAPVCGFVHEAGATPKTGSAAKRADIAARLVAAGTPVWAFHGEADDVVPPDQTRQLAAAMAAAGGSMQASYFPGLNHNCWDQTYRTDGLQLAQWLLKHRRPLPRPNPPR